MFIDRDVVGLLYNVFRTVHERSGSSASSSSDVEAWKGLRFSYDRVFINQDFDDPDDLDMNGFSVDYEHAFKVAKKLPLFIQTGIGINFSRHSDSESESDEYYGYTVGYESKNSITQLGLNIPINLVYGVKSTNSWPSSLTRVSICV